MSRVLVTGAGGFIGRHLVQRQVESGQDVRALDLHLDGIATGSIEPIECDIRNRERVREALQGCDVVFHLASAHLSLRATEQDYWDVNVKAARSLVEDASQAGVRRFVHCSSVGVHGEIRRPPANEDSECHPELIYERTKWEGEKSVRELAQASGFPLAVVRPVWVYGPGCGRTEKLMRTVRKGRFFYVGSGTTLRHCVYISDMIDAFELAATVPAAVGQVVIVGDGGAVTLADLMKVIADTVGAPPPKIHLPLWAMWVAGVAAETAFGAVGKEPPLSRRSLKFFTNNTSFDISRARTVLGYEPKVSLREGMKRTYEWLREQGRI